MHVHTYTRLVSMLPLHASPFLPILTTISKCHIVEFVILNHDLNSGHCDHIGFLSPYVIHCISKIQFTVSFQF